MSAGKNLRGVSGRSSVSSLSLRFCGPATECHRASEAPRASSPPRREFTSGGLRLWPDMVAARTPEMIETAARRTGVGLPDPIRVATPRAELALRLEEGIVRGHDLRCRHPAHSW